MGDWINRPNLESDWMSLTFLINLLIIMILYKLDRNRLKSLTNIFKIRIYFGKYSDEKQLNYFSYFNFWSSILILNSISLTYFSFSNYSPITLYSGLEYYYLLLGLSFIVFLRHLLIQFVFIQLELKKKFKLVFYKNFTLTVQTSIFLIGLVFLWNYITIPSILIESILLFVTLYWFINQFSEYFSFFKSRPQDLIYIILYLCTFKLAPWIWIYLFFLQQNCS